MTGKKTGLYNIVAWGEIETSGESHKQPQDNRARRKMHERTFMSALERPALLAAADSDDADSVVLGGVVVCYQHFSVGLRYDDLPLLTT